MRKKIIKAAAILLTLSFAATAIYYYLPQPASTPPDHIISFKEDRDTKEILDIFNKDWYWLVSNENFSPEFVLKNRAPGKEDTRYYGKLIIKVLYDEKNQFVGFVAYYMKNFFIGTILFIDVKPEYRGKGYAQQLVQHAFADLKKQGATIITLVTRTNNESALKLYKKLGFRISYQDDGYVYLEFRP